MNFSLLLFQQCRFLLIQFLQLLLEFPQLTIDLILLVDLLLPELLYLGSELVVILFGGLLVGDTRPK